MDLFRKVNRLTWTQLNMAEQITMLAMISGPQRNVEWLIQRALCFHKTAEITPQGLKLTRFGRQVMAERHGLPVVVGRMPEQGAMAVLG